MSVSLLDTVGMKRAVWYLVYHDRDPKAPHLWFTRWLKPGFRHVELTRSVSYGPAFNDVLWLNILPSLEMLEAEIGFDPTPPWVRCPHSKIQSVAALRENATVRSWFHLGPMSCVEIAKYALGIKAFWLRTPYQLYKYIQRRAGVVISR